MPISVWNLSWPSGRLILPSWFHTASDFRSSLQPGFNSDSSSRRKSLNSYESSFNTTAESRCYVKSIYNIIYPSRGPQCCSLHLDSMVLRCACPWHRHQLLSSILENPRAFMSSVSAAQKLSPVCASKN